MKPGYIVKISKRFAKFTMTKQRFRVTEMVNGEVYMIGLEDGCPYYADPEQLVIVGVNR